VSLSTRGIPVFSGPRIIAYCDAVSIRAYLTARNAEIVRKRKTGEIMQINLLPYGDDSTLCSIGDSASPTYEEQLEIHTLTVLKRYDDRSGRLVRWNEDDGFNPRRFNPDRVQVARQPDEPELRHVMEIASKPADAPRVPSARFCIRRNPSLPWSAENSREVF